MTADTSHSTSSSRPSRASLRPSCSPHPNLLSVLPLRMSPERSFRASACTHAMACGCSKPIKARRITCHAWQPSSERAAQAQAQAAAAVACAQTHRNRRRLDGQSDATSSGIRAARWIIAHFHCLCIFMLLVSGINLPLLAAASASVSAPSSESRSSATAAATSTVASAASSLASSTIAPLKPHVVLLSLPWRGHMMPLLNLGARLVARGFHVSMGVATEEARDFVAAQAGSSIEIFTAGNFKACARVKRIRETQPLFEGTSDEFDAALQATLHPGAQLTDLYAAPYFAFQATDFSNSTVGLASSSSSSTSAVAHAAPNGVIALMRTYAAFQACMGSSVTAALSELTHPEWSDTRWKEEKEKQRKEKQKFKEKEREKEKLIVAASTGSAALKKKEKEAREVARNEREQALFPPVLQVSIPKLIVVDRFTFAGLDAAKAFNISYVVNNPVSRTHTRHSRHPFQRQIFEPA